MSRSEIQNTMRRLVTRWANAAPVACAGALLLALSPMCDARPERWGGRFEGTRRGAATRLNDGFHAAYVGGGYGDGYRRADAYGYGVDSRYRYGAPDRCSDDLYAPAYSRVYGVPLISNSWVGGCGYGWGYGAYRRYGGYSFYDGYYDSPAPYFSLVEVDSSRNASRRRVGSATTGAASDFHMWQVAVRDTAAVASASRPPRAPSAARAADTLPMGVPEQPEATAPGSEPAPPAPSLSERCGVAWDALGNGRLEEAQRLFARGADAPVEPGSADLRAGFSLGFALAAAMLGREEAAAWALRRAGDLDPDLGGRVPWSNALRERIGEAAKVADAKYRHQPTPDRAVIAGALARLVR